jgi:ABC-type transport system involved in multi-copper enzyme maturation permease subunit
MRKAWLIARKDLQEGLGRAKSWVRVLVAGIGLPIFYGWMMTRALNENPEHARAITGQVVLFASLLGLMGPYLGVVIAAQAIVGERERRTIESLLATPVSDLEVFGGKLLAGIVPSLLFGYGMALLFFATVRLLAGPQPVAIPVVTGAARLVFMAMPFISAIFLAVILVISAHASTALVATQLGSLVNLPVLGGMVYLAHRSAGWSLSQQALVVAALAAAAMVLLYVGSRALGREEIIARLD